MLRAQSAGNKHRCRFSLQEIVRYIAATVSLSASRQEPEAVDSEVVSASYSTQYAPIADSRPKYRFSLQEIVRYIAATVSLSAERNTSR